MNNIITNNLTHINAICKHHHVKQMWAFGSVCTDKFNDKSDIDLLVAFDVMNYGDYADNYFLLCDTLENLFKRKVDLITNKSLSNPYFISSINKNKTVLYE